MSPGTAPNKSSRSRRQRGFTLIEVLVGLIVLTFGVLSAMGLQAISKRSTQNAAQRTVAVHLGNDLLERVRNNFSPPAVDLLLTQTRGREMGGNSFGAEPSPDCTEANRCTPGQLVLHDLWAWEQLLDGASETTTLVANDGTETKFAVGGLVDPAACFYGPPNAGDGRYTIVIVWRSSSASPNPVTGDANIDGCANDTNRYGDNNVYRRLVTLSSFIAR